MDSYIEDRSGVTVLMIYFSHVLLEATMSHADTFSLGYYCITKFCDTSGFSNGFVKTRATYGLIFQKLIH